MKGGVKSVEPRLPRRFERQRAAFAQTWTSPAFRVFAGYFSSNSLSLVALTFSGLLVARWAGPANMAMLLAVTTVLPYLQVLSFGVPNGLNRDLPYYLGKGEQETALAFADAAWWYSRKVAIAYFLVFFGGAVFYFLHGGPHKLIEIWLAYALIAPVELLMRFVNITYRTNREFAKLSRLKVYSTVFGIISLVMVFLQPWYGMLSRLLLTDLFFYYLLVRHASIRPTPRFSSEHLVPLIKTGIPLFAAGWVASLSGVLDRTMIVHLFGLKALEAYVPAYQITIGLSVLPMSINAMLYPRMCIQYGKYGTAHSLMRMSMLPSAGLAVVLLPVFGFGIWFVDPFVRAVLPAYVMGIPAARWIVVAMYFKTFPVSVNAYMALKKLTQYTVVVVVSMVIMVLATLYAARVLHWGVEAVAFGVAVSSIVYAILTMINTFFLLRPRQPA